MPTATNRLGMPFLSFEYLRVWYLRRTLANALKREQRHREAAERYRAEVLPDLERRLLTAEMGATVRSHYPMNGTSHL